MVRLPGELFNGASQAANRWIVAWLAMKTSYYDYRYYPSGRVAFRTTGQPMRINYQIRRCVLFLAAKKEHDFAIRATGFMVGYPIKDTEHRESYVVTAKHVVDDLAATSIDGCIYCCFNEKDGQRTFLRTNRDE